MKDCCCDVTVADAGEDQVLDCITYATLAGNKPLVGCGKWTFVSGSGNILNPRKYNSRVVNLSDGTNVLKWKISHDCQDCVCSDYSEDTVSIEVTC